VPRCASARLFWPLALAGCLLPAAAGAQLSFPVRTDYANGSRPRSVALGDLNHDGFLDLVTANAIASTISVRLNVGNGTFGPRADFATGTSPYFVTLGDVDGDGNPDAITANRAAATVSVLRGNGGGSFLPRADYAAGPLPVAVAIRKLGARELPDLVVANNNTAGVFSILLNGGDGTFPSVQSYPWIAAGTAVAAGQLDSDEDQEYVVATDAGRFYIEDAQGVGPAIDALGTATGVAIADMNRDGTNDVVATLAPLNELGVITNNSPNGVGAGVSYPTGLTPVSLVAGDLSGDGWGDVAVVNYASFTVSLFHGNGVGGLTAVGTLATGTSPRSIAGGDLNHDGLPDLAVANDGSSTVSIFLQSPSPPLIRAVPASLAFGQDFLGNSATLGVRVQNVGTLALVVSDVSVTGSEFSMTGEISFTLARGEYRDFTVRYARAVAGSFNGSFIVRSNASGRPTLTVPLTGSTIHPPIAAVSPESLTLAARAGAVAARTLTLLNTGLGGMTFQLSAVGPQPAWLSFSQTPGTVAPGGTAATSVQANATALVGGDYSALIRVSTNDPQRPRIDVPVTLVVTGMPRIAFTPGALTFATGFVGHVDSLALEVRNAGTDTLRVTGMTTDSPEFVVSGATGFALAPGAARTSQLRYLRLEQANPSATLSVASNDSVAPIATVALTGTTLDPPRAVVTPAVMPEVTVAVGDSAHGSVAISNASRVARLDVQVRLDSPPGYSATPPFAGSPLAASIDPLGSIPYAFVYRGLSHPGRTLQGTLTVTSNDPVTPQIQRFPILRIRGIPRLALSAPALDFGPGFLGSPDTLAITLSNTGSDTLHVSGAGVAGPEFGVLDPAGFALTAGNSRPIRVRYARTSAGNADATLTIVSDDPANPVASVRLLGSSREGPAAGVSPASIEATLVVGASGAVSISVQNGGLGTLQFSIDARRPGGPQPAPGSARVPDATRALPVPGADQVFSTGDPVPGRPGSASAEAPQLPLADPKLMSSGATPILVIGDGGTENDVVPLLAGAGYAVTLVADDSAWDGAHPSPDAFATVVLLDGPDFGDDMPISGQQSLVRYVTGGGGLIVTEWISYEVSQGRYALMKSLIPITRETGVTGILAFSVVGTHPVTSGVSASFQVTGGVTLGTANSGVTVVALSDGAPAVVVKEEGMGRVVAFALAGNYNQWRPFLASDPRRLLLNAVSWVSGFPWLSFDARVRTVSPGGKELVGIALSAARLAPGTQLAEILIDSDDPASPRLVVPLRLTVVDPPTPALVSLVKEEVEADRVRLVWHVAGAEHPMAALYRSRAEEGWVFLRELEVDGSGLIVCEDREVTGDERYGYRLGLREGGEERIVGEAWIRTPAASFALHSLWPQPAVRDLVVTYSLPDREDARIELFDVNGRRRLDLPLTHPGAGRHEASLSVREVVPPGVYWVRLTHRGRFLTARALVLR